MKIVQFEFGFETVKTNQAKPSFKKISEIHSSVLTEIINYFFLADLAR
jgi:hypothetical protein